MNSINNVTIVANDHDRGLAYYLSRRFVVVLITILLLLPARFYISYSITTSLKANLNVNYLNIFDIASVFIAVFCMVFFRNKSIKNVHGMIFGIYVLISLVNLIGLAVTGNVEYSSEIFSKILLLLVSIIVADFINYELNARLKTLVYLLPLTILVAATFFLSGYGAFATSNRVGTLGFGSNESAMFACVIIAIALFIRISILVKLGLIALGLASILIVSSRRGLIVALGLFALYGFYLLFKKKNKFTINQLLTSIVFLGLIAFICIRYHSSIYSYITKSPLVIRLNYSAALGESVFDVSDRENIFSRGIWLLKQKPILGYMGCDKLFAQGALTHNHNLLLQIIVIYGFLFGSIICIYFVTTFCRAGILLVNTIRQTTGSSSAGIVSIFYIIYFGFDMFGYFLWNPKGYFWVLITSLIVNEEYIAFKRIRKKKNNNM